MEWSKYPTFETRDITTQSPPCVVFESLSAPRSFFLRTSIQVSVKYILIICQSTERGYSRIGPLKQLKPTTCHAEEQQREFADSGRREGNEKLLVPECYRTPTDPRTRTKSEPRHVPYSDLLSLQVICPLCVRVSPDYCNRVWYYAHRRIGACIKLCTKKIERAQAYNISHTTGNCEIGNMK
jgi:hypothetical protein